MNRTPLGIVLSLICMVATQVAPAGDRIVHDGEYQFLRHQYGERWDAEDATEVSDASGAVVRMVRQVEAVDGELVHFSHTFTSAGWGEAQVSRSTLRFLAAEAVAAFLEDAGLRISQQFGDWNREPLTASSAEIITIAAPV